ncbi:peptidase domain-containing ABC transporter [Pedobacter sp. SYSU D00535]|uniref:peptidase domain-containing ABC transporter n=1 Tax=Pedobacter sp. SYSU D00535 TaxID=2810308 RepID=UPI001A977048|nr:ABC transporter ATP-binding protein [Pedobacter sp. SYSU D00535]
MERKEITSVYIYAVVSGIILLSLPLGIQAIINLVFGGTVSTSLIVLIVLVVIGVLLNGILQIAQMRASERIQQRIFTRLTFAYAYRIPRLNLLSIDKYYLPELVNRFFDTASLQKGLSKLLLDFPAASIQVLFGLILLSFYHSIFIAFGFLLAVLVIMIFYVTSPKGLRTSIRESDYKYDVAHWLEEISRSIKTFKFYQHNDLHLKKTDKLVNGYLHSRDEHFSVLVFQYRIVIAFKVLITAGMLIIGSLLFINQQINLGQFIAAEIIIITIINSVEKLIVSLEVLYDVLTSLEKINKVLEKPQDSEEGLINEDNWSHTPGIAVKLTNVTFGYDKANPIIRNLDLDIKSGEKVCITGSEGSGKSTLLTLLSGTLQNFTGNILYNGVPLKSLKPQVLHKNVAMYLTEEELFGATLLENITVGKNNPDLGELNKVCDLVGLTEFINMQQQGLGIVLDPQGKKLSYNTTQKILLARCLFMKPSLLLLEDGWMGLEAESKNKIIDFLTSEKNPCTVVAISNDAVFASKCDRVIRMKDGSVTNS